MSTKLDTYRKVFIVHHSKDYDVIQKYIIVPLEKEELAGKKVECITSERDFIGGKQITESIHEAVQESDITFVILTKTALERHWVKYETLLALEKSQRAGRLFVTLILFDVDPLVAQDAWFGLLTDAMMILVDCNKDTWEKDLVQQMKERILSSHPLKPIQIAANLATGQVWSHFCGYTRLVLPKLREKIHASKWYQVNKGRFAEVEINLIPQSAKTVRTLSELHESIEYEGDLDPIIAVRGNYQERKYTPPVYSILDPKEKSKYYFVAQIPNTLNLLSKLELQEHTTSGTETAGRPALKISKGERSLQVARFSIAMNRLVNHPRNEQCNNMIRLVNFDDSRLTGKEVAKMLLEVVKDECKKKMDPNYQAMEGLCIGVPEHAEFERSVYVDYDDRDCETAATLKDYLKRNGLKVFEDQLGKLSLAENFETALNSCKWCIPIMSIEALHSEDSHFLMFRWRTALHASVDQNQVRVIPVLDGVSEENIPSDLCALTYLVKDPQGLYMQRIVDIINCRSIKMEATVSARDVYQGLAWAYVGYLELSLNDRLDGFEALQKKYPGRRVYKKLLCIVPSSCSDTLRALDRNQQGEQIDARLYQLPELQIRKATVGGVNREYQLIPYCLQSDLTEMVLVMEYPNPVVCLQEMAQLSVLSGLKPKDVADEALKFKDLTQSIIDHIDSIRNKVKMIYYDDSKSTVVDALLEVLESEPESDFLS